MTNSYISIQSMEIFYIMITLLKDIRILSDMNKN